MEVFLTKIEKIDLSRSRLKTGQVYFGDPERRCPCLIWFRSPSEALIEVSSDVTFPKRLRLISAAMGVNKLCDVTSRQGRKIRLRFGT
jgi:hypothetical protein